MKSPSFLRRLFKWAVFFLLMGIILVLGIYLRNFLLKNLQARLGSAFKYSQVRLSLFPARLIFEKIEFIGENPSFSAQRLSLETRLVPFARARPVKVIIEEPIIRYRFQKEAKKIKPALKLPSTFLVEQVLLRKAEIWVDLDGQNLWAKDLRALWKRRGNAFDFEAEAPQASLSLSNRPIMSSSQLKVSVVNQGGELKINRFLMTEADRYLQLKGTIKNFASPEANFHGVFWFPMEAIDSWLNLPFAWKGKVTSQGQLVRRAGRWSYQGEIVSSDLELNGLALGQARGWLESTLGLRGDLAISFELHGEKKEFSLSWEKDKLAGQFANFYLDPILKGLKLPWPVKSPSWGKFYLANRKLTIEGELREKNFEVDDNRYPFQGYYYIEWDTQKKVLISARDFLSNFARFKVEAKLDLGENLEMEIESEIADIASARIFLQNLLKKKWNLPVIKGQAEAKVNIFGRPRSPEITVRFDSSPLSLARFEVKEASGQFKIASGRFEGYFRFQDPFLAGETEVLVDSSGLSAFIAIRNGDWSKAFNGLGLKFPLRGRFEGPFNLSLNSKGEYFIKGEFLSPEMNFLGQPIKGASGLVTYELGTFKLQKFSGELAGGRIAGQVSLNLRNEIYSGELFGQNLSLEQLIAGVKGRFDGYLKGAGKLGQDKLRGSFEIRDLVISIYKKPQLRGQTEILFSRQGFEAKLFAFENGEESFEIETFYSFGQPRFSVQGKGRDNLLTIIPWKGTSGSFNYLFEIRQEKGKRDITGVFETKGTLLPFPNFPHPLTDFSLLILLNNRNLSIRSLQGKLGGGDLEAFGEIRLQPGFQFEADIQLDGWNMVLSPIDRTRFLTDASLRLLKKENRFTLEGLFSVKKAFWRRDFFEKVGIISPSSEKSWLSFLNGLTLALRLKADDQAWVENSLAKVRGRFDLSINGDIKAPFIIGEIEALDGSVFFQERVFKLLKGKIILTEPTISVPYLEVKGETYVQDYRVTFSLSGPIDRLKPEFSSSPPLASEEILALLALGESFKRITSTDVVSQVSTASFLSGEIIEEAKKKAQRILNLDRLRIDPFVLGSSAEMTARLTVGKKISENFFIIYSTNLTTQREEIVRVEWELKPGLSIVGIRDELGRLSFDLKIRRRF
ncbi:MAG: translocation/assembly module TamB [Candidatus Aminicenantes bacterium]|nr:translocation/assembly module TamB [Candidatus Aminicenantes bacterium]